MWSSFRCCIRNTFHNCAVNYCVYREARMLNKMIERGLKKKELWNELPKKAAVAAFSGPYINEGNSRKMKALNKVYMEELGTILDASETCKKLLDLGFEISKVQMSDSRTGLHIFWILRKANIKEETILELLPKAIAELKEVLSTRRYMGRIPTIKFFRDVSLERGLSAEEVFNMPEFKRDVELTHPEKVYSQFDNKPGEALPEMRQDLLGLDHQKMKMQIKKDMERHKVFSPKGQFEQANIEPGPLVMFDRNTFNKFYRRKTYLEKKIQMKESVKPLSKQPEEGSLEDSEDGILWEYKEEDVEAVEEFMNSEPCKNKQ